MQGKLETWYLKTIDSGDLTYDKYQIELIKKLDTFANKITKVDFSVISWLSAKLGSTNYDDKLGYYIYGSVGRGKTMIINEFYHTLDTPKKCRFHFHEFMNNIHQNIFLLKNIANPLNKIATDFKKKYDIIFLDEMHVGDIATAMILKNLFLELFKHKVYCIVSSNYSPDELYKDGLLRDRFIPSINLLKTQLNVIKISGHEDYRMIDNPNKTNTYNKLFFINDINAHNALDEIYHKIRRGGDGDVVGDKVIIQSRWISCIKHHRNIIWFDFDVVCGDNRSKIDYLEIAKRFDWVIIENVYKLDATQKDVARRFTWFIDILYDNHNQVAISLNCTLDDIYIYGEYTNEFIRTKSRLYELSKMSAPTDLSPRE